jgi:hypothetical protein
VPALKVITSFFTFYFHFTSPGPRKSTNRRVIEVICIVKPLLGRADFTVSESERSGGLNKVVQQLLLITEVNMVDRPISLVIHTSLMQHSKLMILTDSLLLSLKMLLYHSKRVFGYTAINVANSMHIPMSIPR